jgi:GT2 family glycosyltransferase
MYPNISVIILNWNGWKDTLECLESLYQIDYPNYNVIVVDNHSLDDSIQKIKEYCQGKLKAKSKWSKSGVNKPINMFEYFKDETKDLNNLFETLNSYEKLILIKNDQNYGFAEGNNIGMRFVLKNLDSDYLLLLNNDTVVEKSFLSKLVELSESDERIGVCGPKILYYNQPEVINSAGGKMLWHMGLGINIGIGETDEGQYEDISETESLLGACLLIKSDVIRKCGLLDNQFFLLLEETDFCIRAKKAGYKILFNPKSVIYHKEGISGELSPLKYYYMYRNRLLIVRKHQPLIKVIIYGLNISLRTLIILIYFTAKGDTQISKSIFRGYFEGISKSVT